MAIRRPVSRPLPSAATGMSSQLVLRIPADLRAWLDAKLEAERAAHPGRRCVMSDVVREVLTAAMLRDGVER